MVSSKKDIISSLQKRILQWQGMEAPQADTIRFSGLQPIEEAFPNAILPTGAMHEFIMEGPEQAAACGGFLSGLLQVLMQHEGICIWISTSRSLFPPALTSFRLKPDRIIFIELKHNRDILWAMEEALKCRSLAGVIAEIGEISFAESRRLQLVVEKSRVTGFILRKNTKNISTACTARWRILPLPSVQEDGLPGLGFPSWKVELLKVRNGNPGSWEVQWRDGNFITESARKNNLTYIREEQRKAG